MSQWPYEIANEEPIVRGICSPYQVDKKGNLTKIAYYPPVDSDEVSVMRLEWIGANACKARSKLLENVAHKKVYKGMAVLSAAQIRASGAQIKDSRHLFDGHADIRHGIKATKGDPVPPPELVRLTERAKELAKQAVYYPDPDVKAEDWTGPTLNYRSG